MPSAVVSSPNSQAMPTIARPAPPGDQTESGGRPDLQLLPPSFRYNDTTGTSKMRRPPGGGVVVTQARAVETRHTVIAAAAKSSEERGYGGTSLSDVIQTRQRHQGCLLPLRHQGGPQPPRSSSRPTTPSEPPWTPNSQPRHPCWRSSSGSVHRRGHDGKPCANWSLGYALHGRKPGHPLRRCVLEQRRATFVGAVKTAIAVPGIEPGSYGIPSRLLRAQFAMSLLGSPAHANKSG